MNNSDFTPQSPYQQRLHPWCIIRHLPQMQRLTVCRFRRCREAEAHLSILRQLTPDAAYIIIFDPPDASSPNETLSYSRSPDSRSSESSQPRSDSDKGGSGSIW